MYASCVSNYIICLETAVRLCTLHLPTAKLEIRNVGKLIHERHSDYTHTHHIHTAASAADINTATSHIDLMNAMVNTNK